VEVSLGNTILLNICGLGLVEGIGVQRLIGNDVVLQECLEILLTILAEEETVDSSTELLEREVGWCKDCPAEMGRGVVDGFKKASLRETEFEGAEFAWKKLNDVGRFWGRDKEAIDAMDNAVCAELVCQLNQGRRERKTHYINGHNATVEVHGQAFETDFSA